MDDVTRQVLDMLRDDSAAVVPAPAIERNGAPGTPVLPAWAHDAVYVPPGAEGSLPGASVSREKR